MSPDRTAEPEGSTWEKRMSQRAKARQAAEKERREAEWRRSLADRWAESYALMLENLPALTGETRVVWRDDADDWKHAGHLVHACGTASMCSCGVAAGEGTAEGCDVCRERRIGHHRQPGIHLHGTLVCCPCGAEGGITCVAFDEEYIRNPPTECWRCGKPVDQWGDLKPYKLGSHHEPGCPLHPETVRCDECSQPFGPAIMVGTGRGWYHLECSKNI